MCQIIEIGLKLFPDVQTCSSTHNSYVSKLLEIKENFNDHD